MVVLVMVATILRVSTVEKQMLGHLKEVNRQWKRLKLANIGSLRLLAKATLQK